MGGSGTGWQTNAPRRAKAASGAPATRAGHGEKVVVTTTRRQPPGGPSTAGRTTTETTDERRQQEHRRATKEGRPESEPHPTGRARRRCAPRWLNQVFAGGDLTAARS